MIRLRFLLLFGFLSLGVHANGAVPTEARDFQCPDANIFGQTLITGICWSCMFPVYLAGIEAFDGRNDRPDGANDDLACFCPGDWDTGRLPTIGFSVGMYLPSRLMESVRKPWCFPALFGADLGDARIMDSALNFGGEGPYLNEMSSQSDALYTWHMYALPLMEILELMDLPQCNVDNYSSFDVMFMSEGFPHWYNEELAFLIQPEALIFGNPIAQAAQLIDCTAASVDDPLDEIFWTAGCWGSFYPITGHSPGGGTAQHPSLIASRAMFLISRLGFLKRTIGSDAMCGGERMPVLSKEQYRWQQLFPVAESSNDDGGSNPPPPDIDPATEVTIPDTQTTANDFDISNVRGGCCHNFGENTMLWGEWRSRPATGEDFVFLIWRWTDCCAGVLGEGGL